MTKTEISMRYVSSAINIGSAEKIKKILRERGQKYEKRGCCKTASKNSRNMR